MNGDGFDDELTPQRAPRMPLHLTDSQRRLFLTDDLFEFGGDELDREIMRRLRSKSLDEARVAARLIRLEAVVRHWRHEDSEQRKLDEKTIEAISKPPSGVIAELRLEVETSKEVLDRHAQWIDHDDKDTPGLRQRVAALEPIGAFAKWALGIAGTALVAVGIFLYARGFNEGTAAERARQTQEDIKQLQERVHQLERAQRPDRTGHDWPAKGEP